MFSTSKSESEKQHEHLFLRLGTGSDRLPKPLKNKNRLTKSGAKEVFVDNAPADRVAAYVISLRRYYPYQVIGFKAPALSQPTDSSAPLIYSVDSIIPYFSAVVNIISKKDL